MKSSSDENPYQSPSEAEGAELSPDTILERASLAWVFPMIGFLLFVGAGYLSQFKIVFLLAVILLLVTLVFWLAGFAMTTYGIVVSREHPHAFGHAILGGICGLILTSVILLGMIGYWSTI